VVVGWIDLIELVADIGGWFGDRFARRGDDVPARRRQRPVEKATPPRGRHTLLRPSRRHSPRPFVDGNAPPE